MAKFSTNEWSSFFFFGGGGRVYINKPQTLQDLKENIRTEINDITHETLTSAMESIILKACQCVRVFFFFSEWRLGVRVFMMNSWTIQQHSLVVEFYLKKRMLHHCSSEYTIKNLVLLLFLLNTSSIDVLKFCEDETVKINWPSTPCSGRTQGIFECVCLLVLWEAHRSWLCNIQQNLKLKPH